MLALAGNLGGIVSHVVAVVGVPASVIEAVVVLAFLGEVRYGIGAGLYFVSCEEIMDEVAVLDMFETKTRLFSIHCA